MDIKQKLSEEFKLSLTHASNIVDLISEGNTIPFIARYRKEMHGGCNDEVLRDFADRLKYLTGLEDRKAEIKASVEGQGKWTEELAAALAAAQTMTEAEDIYRPYKQKKKTRASVAIEKGLEPLADIIMAQDKVSADINELAEAYINEEKGVLSAEDAISGAKDIIAERISDDAELRKSLREYLYSAGLIKSAFSDKADKEKAPVYEMYNGYSEKISTLPPHRILALNRGEKEDCLKINIEAETEGALNKIRARFIKPSAFLGIMEECAADSYERLIFPSVEREVRNDLTEKAEEQAIKMFEVNLKPLLMQPPLKGKVIMGVDPAYRTGCKIAVIDENGNLLEHTVIFPTPPQSRIEESEKVLASLIKKYNVDVLSIGNGTASKETEIFVSGLIKKLDRKVSYAIVNEAGASVYSASKLGTEEFPDKDVTVRSAVSIARRLLDPLAELIKIDVKSIGVGQYQHDMPQKRLTEVLEGVVEDCVNSVGVDLNTASVSLLSYISGLNSSIAKNIVEYRKSRVFKSRGQLMEVNKLGPKAFEQCAGFLRVSGGDNILDMTGVHPESYLAAEYIINKYGYTGEDVKAGKLIDIKNKIKKDDIKEIADKTGVGEMTVSDIIDEIAKPGRDVRDALPPVELRADIMDLKDLKEGMILDGVVRNVIDFGAFIDIGVHQDGLVHISEISDSYIKHPSEALTVGEKVKVKVLGVDVPKNRISLSIKAVDGGKTISRSNPERPDKGGRKNYNDNKPQQKEKSLDEMLAALKNKFSR